MAHKKFTAILLTLIMLSGLTPTALASGEVMRDASDYVGSIDNANIDPTLYLDYSAGIEAGVYHWILSEDGSYYTLTAVNEEGNAASAVEAETTVDAPMEESTETGSGSGEASRGSGEASRGAAYDGVYMSANVTNPSYQTMLIYVPAAYLTIDEDGVVTGIDHDAQAGNYTADTAPIIYANECVGWRSSTPRSCDTSYIRQGMIYVAAGARSRGATDENGIPSGKAPTQVVDLKAGVIELRANADVIPGNKDRVVSIGTSGGGEMSSIFGASGNMPEYFEYMYESGVLGVTKNADGTYTSAYPDNVFAAQCFCPIADIEDADIAYAWWWVDLADDGGVYNSTITDFERRLQELEADAFVEYLNSLGLSDTDGNTLTLDSLRSGSFYDAILQNLTDALNAMVEAGSIDPEAAYSDHTNWLTQDADGVWHITDLRGFMIGTGLVNNRNKAIPGFDKMDKSAENNAFGTADEEAVHYSISVAQILSDNYEELSKLEGFNAKQVDNYIDEALTGSEAQDIAEQVNLMNATEILLGYDGLSAVDPAQHWRVRSGTADQHTSFTIGYNLCLAAQSRGLDADYHLVWNMGHGSNEGSSTGTFIDWVNEICA